jgi:O-acetylserine/cysteine efflux transporter
MNTDRRRAVAALTASGLLWGTTVPLSKLALGWLAPGWLTFVRFGLAAAILLAVAPRAQVRAACTPSVLASGAIGYGGSVVVQNAGITRTSVSHAALLIGATPVLVAIIAALWHRTVARPVAWVGFAVSLAGVGLVAGGGGGGATVTGDGLVLASLLVSAAFTVAQARRLQGRDPVALTAVQFLGAALAALPFSMAAEGVPALPAGPGVVLAVAGLAVGGTLLPFTLFAYAQGRVSPEVAGAFLNLEPLVGAVAGVVVFGDPAGPVQLAGGAAILAGIALSSLPLLGTGRRGRSTGERRQDVRRPWSRPRLLSQRPQARSPLARSPRSQSPQPQSPQSGSPQSGRPEPLMPEPRRPESRRPEPRRPEPQRPQPSSPRSGRTQPGGLQPRKTQPGRPQRERPRPGRPQPRNQQPRKRPPGGPRRRGPRPRNALPGRPPPRPGPARRAAYRAAARACRWAITGRRGRLRADRGSGPRCRLGSGRPPAPPGRRGATLPLSMAAAPAAARDGRGLPTCPQRWGTW